MRIYNRRLLALAGIKLADVPPGYEVGIRSKTFFRMLLKRIFGRQ